MAFMVILEREQWLDYRLYVSQLTHLVTPTSLHVILPDTVFSSNAPLFMSHNTFIGDNLVLKMTITLLFHLFKFVNASKIISGENIIHNNSDRIFSVIPTRTGNTTYICSQYCNHNHDFWLELIIYYLG